MFLIMSMARKPSWARFKVKFTDDFYYMSRLLRRYSLNTVCVDAHCPNIYRCWGRRTATFMILGNVCTRSCKFCSVEHGDPGRVVDWDEPKRVAEAVKELGLRYVIITSVDRDDLPDGGASVYAETIREIKKISRDIYVEVLIPDFNCSVEALKTVVDAGPNVVSHNIETVERLTPIVRDVRAGYHRSLKVLKMAKDLGAKITKSGIMLGFGEKFEEVVETMRDLRRVGVDVLTIGQYLQPTRSHLPVVEYVSPEQFKRLQNIGYELGFRLVIAGPRVRSSYLSDIYGSKLNL